MLVDALGNEHLRANCADNKAYNKEDEPRDESNGNKTLGGCLGLGHHPRDDHRSQPQDRAEPGHSDRPRPLSAVQRTQCHRQPRPMTHDEVSNEIEWPTDKNKYKPDSP